MIPAFAMHIPRPGFHSITPYLFVKQAAAYLDHLRDAFGAVAVSVQVRPDGTLMHAELRIGDSMLMVGEAPEGIPPTQCSLYLYLPDCDAAHAHALAHGAVAFFPIATMPSGERYGGVHDTRGNLWWIASHVEELSLEEQEKRWREFRTKE